MQKIKNTFSRSKAAIVATGVAIGSSLQAAAVAVPATTQSDLETTVSNGGTVAIAVVVAILGTAILIKVLKKV